MLCLPNVAIRDPPHRKPAWHWVGSPKCGKEPALLAGRSAVVRSRPTRDPVSAARAYKRHPRWRAHGDQVRRGAPADQRRGVDALVRPSVDPVGCDLRSRAPRAWPGYCHILDIAGDRVAMWSRPARRGVAGAGGVLLSRFLSQTARHLPGTSKHGMGRPANTWGRSSTPDTAR